MKKKRYRFFFGYSIDSFLGWPVGRLDFLLSRRRLLGPNSSTTQSAATILC
jgi:hypothetical protein